MRKKKTTLKRKELSRYELRKRKEISLHRKRSKAAKQGWETRRKNERKRKRKTKKKIAIPTHREFMILIDYRGKHKFKADVWMVSGDDSDSTVLADQARRQLPSGTKFLANWFEGGFSEIAKGKLTSEPKQTRVRSFKRH